MVVINEYFNALLRNEEYRDCLAKPTTIKKVMIKNKNEWIALSILISELPSMGISRPGNKTNVAISKNQRKV